MHDLHLANQIMKLILEYAQKNKLKKVTGAVIELGQITEHGSEIAPENLEFNLKMLAQKTLAEGLNVVIRKVKGDSWVLKEIEGE
ncbi:MAG: hydrogenase/urease maturation nickel metallochaperone HypA [Candidatus Parcubacteria bacterium]|nr:hydrogenase/urease maturation nickel metallochaperone HypA [Candidatus Parcubacteria bacterium]